MTGHMTQHQLGSRSQTVMRDRHRYRFPKLTNTSLNYSRTAPPVVTNYVRAPPIFHHLFVKCCQHATFSNLWSPPKCDKRFRNVQSTKTCFTALSIFKICHSRIFNPTYPKTRREVFPTGSLAATPRGCGGRSLNTPIRSPGSHVIRAEYLFLFKY
jgi:hypothetical protein